MLSNEFDDREQTCQALRALSQQRIFWIELLSRNQFLTPLSCPLYEDFLRHNLSSLQSLAWQALRNKKSIHMSRHNTFIAVREIHSVGIPRAGDILFLVPGTNLVVLQLNHDYGNYSLCDREASCWDTSSGEKICSVQLEYDVYNPTSLLQERGKCSICLETRSSRNSDW